MKLYVSFGLIALLWVFSFAAMAADKVVVIPLNSNSSTSGKLWGQGRPGTGLLTHTDPNGYCTTSQGIHYALSQNLVTWQGAAESCPAGTWVCSESEFPPTGSCDIQPLVTYKYITCSGSFSPLINYTALYGWLADAKDATSGHMQNSDLFALGNYNNICFSTRTWCCWN